MNPGGYTRNSGWLVALALLLAAAASAQSGQSPIAHSHRQVLVSLADRKLAILEDGSVIRVFPVAVGASLSPSPVGTFQIVSQIDHPTYYHPGVVIPAGRNNPLGPRWIGLSKKGYGIHGTNDPRSVGKAASHGCIRMRNRDVEQLYRMVRVGDEVEIRDERDVQVARIFGGEDTGASLHASADWSLAGGQ